MKNIFGTDDFEKLKQNLKVTTAEDGKPYLGYYVKGTGESIPVADIDIRQNGRGYGGGSIRFDMSLNSSFANRLKEATAQIYSPDVEE